MRNLNKRGLDFYSPHRTHLISSAYRPLFDREEVRYAGRGYSVPDLRRRLVRGCMAVSRGARDPRALVIGSILVVLFGVLFVVNVGSEQGEASLFPVNVRGFIEDSAHNRLNGANVKVEMVRTSDSYVRATQYYDTLSNGFYTVSFTGDVWDPNDMIRVTATYGGDSNQNSTLATDDAVQYVNVTLLTVIPEFGDILGSPISVVSIGLIALIVVVRRRRVKDPLAPV